MKFVNTEPLTRYTLQNRGGGGIVGATTVAKRWQTDTQYIMMNQYNIELPTIIPCAKTWKHFLFWPFHCRHMNCVGHKSITRQDPRTTIAGPTLVVSGWGGFIIRLLVQSHTHTRNNCIENTRLLNVYKSILILQRERGREWWFRLRYILLAGQADLQIIIK